MEERELKKKRRKRRGKRRKVKPEVNVKNVQIQATVYPHIVDRIKEHMEWNNIGTRSEAIRDILEEHFEVDAELRKQYREQVSEARKRAGRTSSRPTEIRAILRKEMKPRTWYTKQELTKIAGASRKTVEKMLEGNWKYFTVDNKPIGNNRVAQVIRLKSKKERETGIEEDVPYEDQ